MQFTRELMGKTEYEIMKREPFTAIMGANRVWKLVMFSHVQHGCGLCVFAVNVSTVDTGIQFVLSVMSKLHNAGVLSSLFFEYWFISTFAV